jgi:hypothetical protein
MGKLVSHTLLVAVDVDVPAALETGDRLSCLLPQSAEVFSRPLANEGIALTAEQRSQQFSPDGVDFLGSLMHVEL